MELLPFSPSDDDLLAVAHAWLARLAEGDYDAAFQLTAHDSYFGWTPDLIRRVIEGYGLPEPTRDGVVHRVSTRPGHDQARHQAVDRWPARAAEGGATSLGEVRVDVPLDGDWSDLTATFEIRQTEKGVVLVLNEIHVF